VDTGQGNIKFKNPRDKAHCQRNTQIIRILARKK
jgi:hypothetical protein